MCVKRGLPPPRMRGNIASRNHSSNKLKTHVAVKKKRV